MEKENKKELAYYLTLYKIEGHQTWRADLKSEKDGFDKAWNNPDGGKHPVITEKNVIRIDRLLGTISPQ